MTSATNPLVDGLQRVLDAQHLAVYGYPVIGVRLANQASSNQASSDQAAADQAAANQAAVDQARQLEAAHRLSRDAVAAQLIGQQATPDASAPDYPPPAPVTDRATAIEWAVRIEDASAAAYRYLLGCAIRAGGEQATIRRQAVAGLVDAAKAAAYWRGLMNPDRPTVPFPGAP